MKGFLGWSWLSNDYKDIWNKVGNIIKKELDCKPIYTNFIFEKKKEKKEKKNGITVMRLQIFQIEKYLKHALVI